MRRALINAVLGDGCFWKHPESVNSTIIWTSTSRAWLEWKRDNLIPPTLGRRLKLVRRRNADGCYPNSKPLYELKTHVHKSITDAHSSWDKPTALSKLDMLDLAIWFLDDGSTIVRKDTKSSFRVLLSVGELTKDILFPPISQILGIPIRSLGRIVKNNSKATARNKSWIIPKPAAVQILKEARLIAPRALRYKVPLW